MQFQQWLQDKKIPTESLLITIFPGGGASWGEDAIYKLWTAEKYAELISEISHEFSVEIVLLGDERDKFLCDKIAAYCSPILSLI